MEFMLLVAVFVLGLMCGMGWGYAAGLNRWTKEFFGDVEDDNYNRGIRMVKKLEELRGRGEA